MSDELGRILVAAQEVVDHAESTYRARNGRIMSIEAEDGEACYIVHSDWIAQLGFALEAFSARPDQSELRTLAEKMAGDLEDARAEIALLRRGISTDEWVDPDLREVAGAPMGALRASTMGAKQFDPSRIAQTGLPARIGQSLAAWNEWKEKNGAA